jgi:probable phosphoglycerate mutase
VPLPEARLYVDGGARGNPGPAGFGVVVEGPEGEPRGAFYGYLGVATNNVAEYRGLLAALEHARHQGWRRLWIGSDSELMVRQIRGEYRVKNAGLKPLFERCRRLLAGLDHFTLEHVPRERNAEADRLANQAMNLRSSDLPPGVSDPPADPKPLGGAAGGAAAAREAAGAGAVRQAAQSKGDAGTRLAYNAPASAQSPLFTHARPPEPAPGAPGGARKGRRAAPTRSRKAGNAGGGGRRPRRS